MNTHLEQLKLTIRDAWRTLSMLPDPDARFRRAFGGGWPLPVVQDANTAYGATPASWLGTPTAHEITEMEEVFVWIVWLLGEKPRTKRDYDVVGKFAVKRLFIWAMGTPVWKMAQRERCSEKTIGNRIDRSIAKISGQFKALPVEIEEINEPEQVAERIRGSEFRHGKDDVKEVIEGTTEAGKVYIGGEGTRIRGEKYRSTADAGEISGGKRR